MLMHALTVLAFASYHIMIIKHL